MAYRDKSLITGRPKGSKNKIGMSVEKRLKVLTKLALDVTVKPSDRISAIAQITSLLNDRVKDTPAGGVETVLTFNNHNNEIKPKQEETKLENSAIIDEKDNTNDNSIVVDGQVEVVNSEEVANMGMKFVIEQDSSTT